MTEAHDKASKRLVIITGSTGSGHNSVADTLRSALMEVGERCPPVDIVDLVADYRRNRMGSLGGLYGPIVVRFPPVWAAIYHISNSRRFCRLFRAAAAIAWRQPLANLLRREHVAAIVCVHPVANQIIGRLLAQEGNAPPLFTVITDFNEAHATWIAGEVHHYFSPSREVSDSLTRNGVAAERITLTGLPVGRLFSNGKMAATRARHELGLDAERFTVLLTGGGDGAGAILETTRAIVERGLPVQLVVVCGRNEGLRKELSAANLAIPHRILGFDNDMPRLFAAADVIVGKAGALTIGEAVVSQRPLILLQPLPGQEKGNARFAARHGVAYHAGTVDGVLRKLVEWLADPHEIGGYLTKASPFQKTWTEAGQRIARAIVAELPDADR